MDSNAKQSTVDRLQQASNVLVTVSSNPSVDQLAACIGFTLFLNKLGKHATAVFSGTVPSTLEFLKPETTLEKNTDSLRDFIISLDKSKADKLRYKVEDTVVKIFITPYRTSIDKDDFEFSQGDFNVDAIVALGVHSREELDKTIVAQGRILHDASIIGINTGGAGNIGAINLQNDAASSLCEMLVDICELLKPDSFDEQMATAFLTGIVAETKRFSNEKTTSVTMSLSAKLMAAGANQQLVATKLQAGSAAQDTPVTSDTEDADGTLRIAHQAPHDAPKEIKPLEKSPVPPSSSPPAQSSVLPSTPPATRVGDVRKEDHTQELSDLLTKSGTATEGSSNDSFNTAPPSRGGTLTANTVPESLAAPVDPMSAPDAPKILSRPAKKSAQTAPIETNLGDQTLEKIENAVAGKETLSEIEKDFGSHHADAPVAPAKPEVSQSELDAAREAVEAAAIESQQPPEPLQSIGAQPVDLTPTQTPAPPSTPSPVVPPDPGPPEEKTGVQSPPAPPPVPPPMMPPSSGSGA